LNGLRGLRTLGPRLRQQGANAVAIGRALEAHPAVLSVRHPGLESHPQFELASRQYRMHGGVLSFELAGGLDAGAKFVRSVKLCHAATSMGGPETLVTHPASTTHAGMTPEELADSGITPGTVRMSCGLEHPDDLIADIMQALA
jgi:methionine-gamma-lyase